MSYIENTNPRCLDLVAFAMPDFMLVHENILLDRKKASGRSLTEREVDIYYRNLAALIINNS